jgi:hypothetical protein
MTSLPARLAGRLVLSDFTDEVKHELDADPKSCALIAAAKKGDLQLGALAVDAGDEVDAVNGDGETALHVALDNGHKEFALWMLSSGANPAMRDRNGQDCTHWAYDDMWIRAAYDRHRSRAGQSPKFSPEVMSLAEHLGVSSKADANLLWVAEAAHNAPLPPNWAEHVDEDGAVFFHCKDSVRLSLPPTHPPNPPPTPPPRTKWTRRVPHSVLIGHAVSQTTRPGRPRGRRGRRGLGHAPLGPPPVPPTHPPAPPRRHVLRRCFSLLPLLPLLPSPLDPSRADAGAVCRGRRRGTIPWIPSTARSSRARASTAGTATLCSPPRRGSRTRARRRPRAPSSSSSSISRCAARHRRSWTPRRRRSRPTSPSGRRRRCPPALCER